MIKPIERSNLTKLVLLSHEVKARMVHISVQINNLTRLYYTLYLTRANIQQHGTLNEEFILNAKSLEKLWDLERWINVAVEAHRLLECQKELLSKGGRGVGTAWAFNLTKALHSIANVSINFINRSLSSPIYK